MKFHRNRLLRYRDTDVLVQTGSGRSNTQKCIFLESDDHADYKNIFCFEIRAKLRNFDKFANFENFGPPF